LNQTVLDTDLDQTTVVNLIHYVRLLIQNIIWPMTTQANPTLLNFTTDLESIFDKLRHLKTNSCKEYEITRKRAASRSIPSKSAATSDKTNSGTK